MKVFRILSVIALAAMLASTFIGCSGKKAEPPLTILSSSSYYEADGKFCHIVGEVKNIGTDKLHSVEIIATFLSASGKVVDHDSTYADIDILMPNQTSPFEYLSPGGCIYISYTLKVGSFSTTEAEPLYRGFPITVDSSGLNESDYYEVKGHVKNTSNQDAKDVYLAATLYDAAGKVVAVQSYRVHNDNYDYTWDSLEYGIEAGVNNTMGCQVLDGAQSAKIASYKIQVSKWLETLMT